MDATEAIIAIDSLWFDDLALSIACDHWAFLGLHINVDHLAHADELIEAKLLVFHDLLVVLFDSCAILSIERHSER